MTDYIKEMLDENTGRALCDSGDIYGRHWERNAKNDVRNNLPEDFCCINTYHWLDHRLEYHEGFTKMMQDYLEEQDDWTYSCAREWAESIGAELEELCYTYNCENQLSQDVQFSIFKINSTNYCIMQTHNGCDARGGMSTPRVFKLKGEEYEMYDFNYLRLEDEDGNEVHPDYAYAKHGKIYAEDDGRELEMVGCQL